MSDLVERLRGFGDDPWPDWLDVVEACKEAADEIERLRARIEEFERLVGFFRWEGDNAPSPDDVLQRARESWNDDESVPLEALSVAACLRAWADEGRDQDG